MNIRLADNNDKEQWDAYVQRHPSASPYHLFAWKRAVEDAYGHKAYYLMAEKDHCITGVLPLIYLKLPLLSGQLVSLPFCDVGDILADNAGASKGLISEAIVLAGKLNAKYIELRSQTGSSSYEYVNLPVSVLSHKVRMFLKLPQSSEMLWDGFKSKLRSQIRKAEKNGLSFKWGTAEDVEDFYVVFSNNMRDLGSPVHSREWFYAVLRHYGENIRIGMVYHDRQLIGAGIILNTNKIISTPWASTLRDFNNLSPNMMLYWNFLKYASDNGYTGFDFGRSTPNEGTYYFKAQWGAQPVPLHWNYIMLSNNRITLNEAASAKKEKMVHIWQNLPLGVANFIGPALRKYISL